MMATVEPWTKEYIPIEGGEVDKEFYSFFARVQIGTPMERLVLKLTKKQIKEAGNQPNVFDFIPKEVFLKKDKKTNRYTEDWREYVDWKKVKVHYSIVPMNTYHVEHEGSRKRKTKSIVATHFLCINNIPFGYLLKSGNSFNDAYHTPYAVIDDSFIPSVYSSYQFAKKYVKWFQEHDAFADHPKYTSYAETDVFWENMRVGVAEHYTVWLLMIKRMKQMMLGWPMKNDDEPAYPNLFYRAVFPLKLKGSDLEYTPMILSTYNKGFYYWDRVWNKLQRKEIYNITPSFTKSSSRQWLKENKESFEKKRTDILLHKDSNLQPIQAIGKSIQSLFWDNTWSVANVKTSMDILNILASNEHQRINGSLGVINHICVYSVPIFTIDEALKIITKENESKMASAKFRFFESRFAYRKKSSQLPKDMGLLDVKNWIQTKIVSLDGVDEYIWFDGMNAPPNVGEVYWAGMLLNPAMRMRVREVRIDNEIDMWAFDYDAITLYKPNDLWSHGHDTYLNSPIKKDSMVTEPLPYVFEPYGVGRASFNRGVLPPLVK